MFVASQLRNCIAAVNKDSTKFFEGNNKAAGTRARKHLQELKSLAQVCFGSASCGFVSYFLVRAVDGLMGLMMPQV